MSAIDSSTPRPALSPRVLFSWRHSCALVAAYEYRSGQLEMAKAVERALAEHPPSDRRSRNRHRQNPRLSVARAPHRTARDYLHRNQSAAGPALLSRCSPFSKRSWATLRVCYMKGRANYLCRHKLESLKNQPILSGLEEIDQSSPDQPVGRRPPRRRPRRAFRYARIKRSLAQSSMRAPKPV